MAAEARKALEALMGAEALGGVPDHMRYDDEKKMDLGSCPKIHSERLKSEYEEAKKRKENDFDAEFERNLANFVSDCDRKIASAQKRLDKTPEDSAKATQLLKEIENLVVEISELTKEVEVLGEQGKVTESIKLLQDVEAKKAAKIEKEKELKNSSESGGGPSQQQKLRVCEVCSAYLSIFDSDRRLADHFGGKMHLGYLKIRDLLKELKGKNKDRENEVMTEIDIEIIVAGDLIMIVDLRTTGARGQDHPRDAAATEEDVHEVLEEGTEILLESHRHLNIICFENCHYFTQFYVFMDFRSLG
ncbi:8494_t:CDS:10 [Acaulospora morrowiae]|uniref:8494_t:CDS:1 n=1 Tax=Acaulospora morrowiae TaxID=94023 RepID=A0A9N8Z6W7_9GLOM|nr:8494_t:CDS:10 [Acaulospora morrowiae]